MPTSLCRNVATRSSTVADLVQDLAECFADGRRTSFADRDTGGSPGTDFGYLSNISISHGNSNNEEHHRRLNPYAASSSSMGFKKSGPLSVPHCSSSTAPHSLPNASDEDCFVKVYTPSSRGPLSEMVDREEGQYYDEEASESSDEDESDCSSGSYEESSEDDNEEQDSDGKSEGDLEEEEESCSSDGSGPLVGEIEGVTRSGAQAMQWVHLKADHNCVGSRRCGSHSRTHPTSPSASYTGSSQSTNSSSSATALPSTFLYPPQVLIRRYSTGTIRKNGSRPSINEGRRCQPHQQQQVEATHNDVMTTSIFTRGGSFAIAPSPPDEGALANIARDAGDTADDGEAWLQSAVISKLSFSYGGPGAPVNGALQDRSSNVRPLSPHHLPRRSSLMRASLTTLQRQSPAMGSVLYSIIDRSSGGAGMYPPSKRPGERPGLEGTSPSCMMPSHDHLFCSHETALGSHAAATRRKRAGSADNMGLEGSGGASGTHCESDDSDAEYSSFFMGTPRAQQGGEDRAGANTNSHIAAAHLHGKDSESPPQRALFVAGSGFSTGINVRVLRGDFKAEDASLDSREFAKTMRDAATATSAASAVGATTAASVSTAMTVAVPASEKAHARQSATASNSPAGITPDSDNTNVSIGCISGNITSAATVPVATRDASRRRSPGNVIVHVLRGTSAPQSRSFTSTTMSSGWGAVVAPNASQQTLVGEWKLLSFRKTDDMPLTNTETVPHRAKKKGKKTKGKRGKKGKKGKRDKKDRGDRGDRGDKGRSSQQRETAEVEAEEKAAWKNDEQRNQGGVARDMVNAVLSGFHSDRSRKDQHPSPSGQTVTEENPISKAVNGKANAAANGGSTPGSTHTNTASGAAAAASGDEEGNVSLAKGGSLASREAMDARPQAPEALPPMTYADAQKRLSGPQWPSAASRLPLRARMTSSSAVGAHRMSSTNGRKTGGDAPQPPSRLLLAPASIMAPETAEAVSTEKTEDHFEKYEEAPVTSPSATTRRTTVRSASRSSVVNAPHRVATCALEKATVGVRRYRPNMNGRLREVMPVPSTRGAPGLCGVAVESSPSQPSERLPPL